MIKDTDDSFHEKNDDPYWNESGWFSFMAPERDLCGWIYFCHRANMNYSMAGFAVWDLSGEDTYDCLFYNFGDTYPLLPEFDMHNFRLPNGVELQCIEPFKKFRFINHNDNCKADLTWTAFMDPVEPGFPEEWGKHHYEQGGKMVGSIEVEGKIIDIDCWSCRDRSWGPRTVSVGGHPRSGFPWAIAKEGHGFIAFPTGNKPSEDDPAYGEEDNLIAGWYIKDGLVGVIVEGERTVTERGHDGRPLYSVLKAKDEHGRILEAEGRWVNWLKVTTYPFLFEWWSLVEWQFDGVTAWGEDEEFWPLQPARRFLRSHKTDQVHGRENVAAAGRGAP